MLSSEKTLREIDIEIKKATYFLSRLEMRVHKPFAIIDRNQVRGFRFAKPIVTHYIVINVARGISLINGMNLLRQYGFKGEMAILARALMENTSKLSYVVGGMSRDGIDRKTREFITDFFADNDRDILHRSRFKPISQKDINRRNSQNVSRDIAINKEFGMPVDMDNDNDQYGKMMSNLYNEFSNHVHGRYPEMMDIYGERSTNLLTDGNLESDDLDRDIDLEFLWLLASGITKGLRTAMLCLNICKLIKLDNEEMNFCMGSTVLSQ
jgi:hypothetical protein